MARRHYPVLTRLARTYRIAAWLGLVVGPLIGIMALSSSFEATGRLLWILLVVAATALMFVTWRATSELIVAMLEMADGLHRAEGRIAGLENKLTEESDERHLAAKRKTTRRHRSATSRARRKPSEVAPRKKAAG